MGDEVAQARRALSAGNVDEALVLLWKALEPARLENDKARLREIAEVAATVPNGEGADLIAATGSEPTPARDWAKPPVAPAPARGRSFTPLLWVVVGLILLVLVGAQVYRNVPHFKFPDVRVNRADASPSPLTLRADGLYLVPLANFPQVELADVAPRVVKATGRVETRPALPLGPTTYDAASGEFVAEEILRRMSEAYEIAEGADALLIGITSLAMHDDSGPATVSRSEDARFVVISTNELGDDARARRERLRRLLLSEIERAGLDGRT
jgi:hypothetical protein